jgi:hypothetical protein
VPSRSPAESSAPDRAGPLGQEIVIGTIDPAQAPYMTAFASDGQAIWFGSGIADRRPGTYAPDLWRYAPGADAPELVWRNPGRERSINVIAGDAGAVAFAEMDGNGAADWNLWLIPSRGEEPILLDAHPGDEDVSSLLPSISISEGRIAWTAFDRGPDGPVSQLLLASAPSWTPQVMEQRDAVKGELWLPSLRGNELAYCELTYNDDRTRDVRHVYLADLVHGGRRQLDTSGLATMPLVVDRAVIWKETGSAFNMFNWGHLVYWDATTGEAHSIASHFQPDLNYPSAGGRFVAVFGYDTAVFEVYDLDRMRWRLIDRYDLTSGEGWYRAHIAGDLIAWLETDEQFGPSGALRWAFMPIAHEEKLDP